MFAAHPSLSLSHNSGHSSTSMDETALQGKGGSAQNMILLPERFEPGEYDVLCGRGRRCFNHIGNTHFRILVSSYLEKYSNASAKLEKSYILSEIVAHVRKLSPLGGFVKKDPLSGRWYEVGDFLAREKTSQAFRDALHDQYKSSNTAKKKRRQQEQAGKLPRGDSCRSLGSTVSVSEASEDSVSYSINSSSSKLMRIGDNPSISSRDGVNGELDHEIATTLVGNVRQYLAVQKKVRSSLNLSCPNLKVDYNDPPPEQPSRNAEFDLSATNPPITSMQMFEMGTRRGISSNAPSPVPQQQRINRRASLLRSHSESRHLTRLLSPKKASQKPPLLLNPVVDGVEETLDDIPFPPCDDMETDLFDKLIALTGERVHQAGNPFEPIPIKDIPF